MSVQEALKTVVDEDERSKNFIIYVLEGNSEGEYDELTLKVERVKKVKSKGLKRPLQITMRHAE